MSNSFESNAQGQVPEESSDVATAGEYVLGVLSHAEREAVEARLNTDGSLRQAVGFWAQQFGAWSARALSPAEAPSPLVWQRIQASLGQPTPSSASTPAQAKPGFASAGPRLRLNRTWLDTFWRLWAGFATACAVGLAVYVVQPILQPEAQQPRYVAVLKSPDKSAEWLIEALPNDTVRLYQLGQLPVAVSAQAQGKSLELWTKAGADAPLTSLGLVQLGKPWVLPAKALPALQNNQLFAVSLEPPNGAPHGQPTGPVVLAGEAVALR